MHRVFLCQDVCHVLRDHNKHDEFVGPRFLVYTAALEMHPLDTEDRIPELKQAHGIGYCNITKCCTKVCPEHITITDNAIIPLKERVVDRYFDPLGWLWKIITARRASRAAVRHMCVPCDDSVIAGAGSAPESRAIFPVTTVYDCRIASPK